ncbi:hypothetical protein RHSIM_RhsimUnG0130500 [Rhododendron simsii]|uniref:Uncharacterized protein n=1 Tax=Rhododendron simsii TaxID=118357 RepID=A0A834FX18_RHOSS|nr:hypothetical protein RHSIM_RhsimUnG0130500 [Rhododendron simsii]
MGDAIKSVDPSRKTSYMKRPDPEKQAEKLKGMMRRIGRERGMKKMRRKRKKQPRKEDGEVIFVFGSSKEVVDLAKFIWSQMVKFKRRSGLSKANIPFLAMVTFICEDQGVMTSERLFPGTPGPITGGSLEKSKSLSQPPPSDTFGFRMPTARTQSGRIEEYMGVMATQLQSMQAKQNKLETQMRRTRRDVSAIKRGMLWIAARCGREGDVMFPLRPI